MAISLVAHTIKVTGPHTNTTDAIDTTGANLLVLTIGYDADVTVTTDHISDNKGNTWTLRTATTAQSSKIVVAYCVPSTVGSGHTFTVALTNVYPAIGVLAFGGAAAVPLDQENAGAVTSGGATSLSAGSITPSENNCVVVSAITLDTFSSVSNMAVTGVTKLDESLTFSNAYPLATGYVVQTTASAINPGWSWTTAANCAAKVVSFKAAAAGATFTPRIIIL